MANQQARRNAWRKNVKNDESVARLKETYVSNACMCSSSFLKMFGYLESVIMEKWFWNTW